MKNVHVFVSASFLYAVTKREFYYAQIYFQIKRIISSEKWRNYVIFFLFFFLKMAKIWVGRTTVNGEKEEDGRMVKMY